MALRWQHRLRRALLEERRLDALEGPVIPQTDYRIYCDLRTYEDDQVRRVYEWFLREAEGCRAPGRWP